MIGRENCDLLPLASSNNGSKAAFSDGLVSLCKALFTVYSSHPDDSIPVESAGQVCVGYRRKESVQGSEVWRYGLFSQCQ